MTTPATSTPLTRPAELTAAELDRAGLLHAENNVQISRFAVFVPGDALSTLRPVTIQTDAVIGAFAVVHGGTTLGAQARIEDHAVVGKPELGYALGQIYPGTGDTTTIGAGAVLRCGAIAYAGACLGVNTLGGLAH
jgi:acyl-[acyl carrier protein]--UDP-N-acetylglucosamine O-acyltransferase